MLNARYHEQEAYIVAQAGVPGAITIATNMAGRGTDIQLGGNAEMRIERELAESRRRARARRARKEIHAEIDALQGEGARRRRPLRARHRAPRIPPHRQPAARPLRPPGRSGPLEVLPVAAGRSDAHLRLRPHGRHAAKLGLKEDEAIVHPWINKAIERAQAKVEARNFDIRKNILKYDNVMNDQRKVVFEQRKRVDGARRAFARPSTTCATASSTTSSSRAIPENAYAGAVERRGPEEPTSLNFLNLDLPVDEWAKEEGIADDEIRERITKAADEAYAERIEAQFARGDDATWKSRCCCRASIISGASTS